KGNKFSTIVCSLILLSFLSSCAIQPMAWTPPPKPAFTHQLSLNERLTQASPIHLLGYYGAEEFAIDQAGNLYCGVHKGATDFSSGAILKIYPDDSVEEFLVTDAWITGMQFDAAGNLIALMNDVGLVKIHPDKTIDTLLTHTPDGKPIRMGTGLKIASDGVIYFVNMSATQKTSPKYINRLILEMKPTGGVYAFNPHTETTTVLSEGNYFGNGLAISAEEDFILVSETSKYRVLKYWIKGAKKGQSEVWMDNLPGFPNNISRSSKGHFWLGFTTRRNDQLDQLHPKVGMKKLVYGLPAFVQPKAEKFGMVIEFSEEGKIIQALFDSEGKTVHEAGAVVEHQGYLYLGGDVVTYVSKSKI
ncbi:MAG: SMP-30/gluconolactonase/LRE family protein, partial [Bacteroidota bacterium]